MGAEPSPTDNLVGQVLSDRYQILHRLGEGAMGVVYKARHVKVGRLFAVKVLNARALQDAKVAQRFDREAELAGRLRHPNVAGVVDVGEIGGTRFLVMDFAEGPDLATLLDEAPMPPDRIIGLVRQMLEGLHHAHEQGLIHRDFKPENVIVEREPHGAEIPRIVDFGIALVREGGDSTDGVGRLTTGGLVLGTPHYMAPEQAVADPIDHRIDLFALGIVVYEMLSGRLPFDGNGAEVARANLLVDPPPISRRVPHLEVDPLLEAFARRLMAKRRDARPVTARAARELLDLIERDRAQAATMLGIPAARSGRAPAVTESVAPGEPGAEDSSAATIPMKPTPKPGQALPPVWPGAARDGALGAGDGAAISPLSAMPVVAARLARPPGVDEPERRTPLDGQAPRLWQRRSWILGSALIGAASITTAVILSLTGPDADPPVSSDRVPAAGAVAARGGSTQAVAPGPLPPRPAIASDPPVPPAPVAPSGDPAPVAPGSADPAEMRAPSAPAPRVRRKEAEAASRPASMRAKDTEPSAREPARKGADAELRAARPGQGDGPVPASPAAASSNELGAFFLAVGGEIRQLPVDEQGDLLGQLARFDIMTEIRAPKARRDQVAAELTRICDQARRRQASHKTQ